MAIRADEMDQTESTKFLPICVVQRNEAMNKTMQQ